MDEAMKIRIEDMVLENETTYKSSYKYKYEFHCFAEHIRKKVPPISKVKPKEEKKAPIYKNPETITPYKLQTKLPFDLFWRPKEILRTTPYDEQKCPPIISDEELNKIRRTRPRVLMVPQVSLDDIPDLRRRDIIINDMYTSSWTRDAKAVEIEGSKIAPMPKFPAPANPVFRFYLPPILPPKVQSEWLMDSIKWESRQTRSYVNSNKQFWNKVDVYKNCKKTAELARLKNRQKS